MAAEHVPVAHAPISGDDLVLLLDDLRLQRRFAIGIDEHLIAQELLATWQARGAGDAIGLRNWLAPVLCTNPEEQAEFYRHFDIWWSARKALALEPARPQPSSVLPGRPDTSRSWVWLGIAAFVSLIVAAVVWNLAHQSAQPVRPQTSTAKPPAQPQPGSAGPAPSTRPSTTTTGGQPPTPRPPAAVSEKDLTVAVNVVDRSGRPIADASACLARTAVTIPASTSTCLIRAQTGQTGETELKPKVADRVQVLVEHPAYDSPAPFAIVQRTGRVSVRAQLAPRAPAWFTWLQRNTRWIQPLATLLPLLVAACWWGWLRSRRRIVLERRASSERGDQAPVSLPPAPRTLYLGDEFVRARVEARRSRAVGSGDLDIDATVERTLDRLGCFSPVYRLRRELPSYLALVDRSSYRDQHARMIDELLDRLVEGNVPLARYYFDRDPRVCAPASGEGEHRTLLELASLHVDHRLMLFSNGAGLTDAVTGRPAGWLDVLSSWSERALMTPLPVCHWSSREIDLSETSLRVVPASAAGLTAFAESLRNPEALSHSVQNETWVPPYPAILQEQPSGWTERNAPTDETIERLCRQLQRYLGVAGYRWLCALSVYPELDWHLTVFMGLRLRGENGVPVLREDSLLALTRLPWLRHGSMPDWLRLRLIDELSTADEGAVRGFLRELLDRRLDSSWSEFQLAVTKPPAATGKRWRRWLVDLLRTEPPGSPLQDRIFVTFVLGGQPHKLQVQAPRAWERWVYERGLRVLGVRAAPVAVLAVALAGAGFATRKGVDALGPVIVPPGESRLALASGVAVPALTGKPQNDAFAMLARIGLTYGTLTQRVATGPAGVVLQQSPAAGAQIARGASVDLVLSIAETPPPPAETFPVTVNVMPWARFTVTPLSSNTRVAPGPYETPAIVELPEGSFDFAFENGGLSGSRTLRVDVSRDGNNSVRFNLPGFDPNAALNAILGTAGR